MEKSKNKSKRKKPSLKMGFIIAFAWIPITFSLIVLGFWLIRPVASYAPVAFEAPSLSESLRLPEQSLLGRVPLNEYIPMTDNFAIRLEYVQYYGNYILCFDGQGISEDMAYQNNSRIVINGEYVPRRNNTPDGAELFSIRPYNRCILVDFDPGLHLVEFRLRDSYFGEPIATQQWAIEIE